VSKFDRFDDIFVWIKARELTAAIYRLFKDNKDYGFRDQIQRASISIMNNIEEGYERKGNKEFVRFLFIAKGSAAEVRSMAYIAQDIGYINDVNFKAINESSEEIARMLSGLIKKIEE
jgi:four helix bundle protein